MSKFIYCLDAGHGGIIDGNYVTAPNKMHEFSDGLTIYEGVQNRIIVSKLADMLAQEGIEHRIITPEQKDIPLSERVARVDRVHAETGKALLISVHLNAGGGRGYEIYTSVGQTISDRIAEYFLDAFDMYLGERGRVGRKDLTDGDGDKEAQFYVLRKTDGPAILTESGFMDNRNEAEWLLSEEGTYLVAKAHFEAIKIIEKIF